MSELKDRDLDTLAGVVKGPGNYASPSADRIERMVARGLIKRTRGILRPTLKGRLVNFLRKLGFF